MTKVRVLEVPEIGYLALGPGTYPKGAIVDVSDASMFDPEELEYLIGKKVIEEVSESSPPAGQ